MQLINVIRRGIAGIADQQKFALPYLAELLSSHRPPLDHRAAGETQLLEQIIGRLCRADVGAREDFRMCDDHALSASDGVSAELEKRLEAVCLEL